MNEEEMRDAESYHPKTENEVAAYIKGLVDMEHDYGTCVYAMSLSALAAYNYVAHKLGVTGFQASCADLDIVKRNRGINGGFIILKGEDLLYPQYDLQGNLSEFIQEQREWLRDEANKKLATENKTRVHEDVWAHWERLAGDK